MHIGVFGGSFDPIHNAHLALAHAALERLPLDQVWFVPAGNPWQRAPLKATPAQRLAMVQLAIASTPHAATNRFAVEDCELNRAGPSYMIDTLDSLAKRHPQHQRVLLLGADQWARLPTWHRWQDVVQRARIAVAQRGPTPLATPPELAHVQPLQIVMPPTATSSTQIRARLAGGASITGLVPEPVARYIAQHHLYEN